MNNRDMPAMPQEWEAYVEGNAPTGLTKREVFAMAAMQGILASDVHFNMDKHDVADQARQHADTLLAELENAK